MVRAGAVALRLLAQVAGRVRPDAATRSPARRSVLDDIAMRRPWNLRVKAARVGASARRRHLIDGVTVVIASWNTREVTTDTVRVVQNLSAPDVRVLVVDNGSTDGSAAELARIEGVEVMRLGTNAGHGVALDLGVLASRTVVAVTLDSDALPLSERWLDPVVLPVRDRRAVVAGLRASRGYVHPVFLAISVDAFRRRRLSFQVHRQPGVVVGAEVWGNDAWDTGELLSAAVEPGEIAFVDPTPNPVAGLPGMTIGDVVYHHGGVSRAADGVVAADALTAWRGALLALGLAERGTRSHTGSRTSE